MDLEPLADLYPPSVKPTFAEFNPGVLSTAFNLQPGQFTLEEAELGIPVDNSSLLGSTATAQELATMAAPVAKPTTKFKLSKGRS